MRIVQLVANLEIGGLERLAVNLARAQKVAGHSPILYCLGQRGAFADEAESYGVPVVAFHKGPGMSPGTVLRIARQLRQDRPNVLHGHNHLVHHYAVSAGRLAGVPVIVNTRHGQEVQILEKADGSGYYLNTASPDRKADQIFRAMLPWTDALIFISEDTRRFFIQHRGIPPARTHVILNGAPLDPFLAKPAAPGSQRPLFRFGTAGRMVLAKDYLLLVEAFAIVARQCPEARLQFAGSGPQRERIEKRIGQLDLGSRVTLHGPVFDMPGYMQGLDAFVLSSISEGLPIVILEAMAAGLPIVSTRVAGVPEAAPEGTVARYAPTGDAPALAAAMLATAADPDLVQLGQNGRLLAQTRFTIEHTWKEHEKLFESLLLSKTGKAA